MTTTSSNYKYSYTILHLAGLVNPGISILLNGCYYEALAIANVRILMKSAVDGRLVYSWNELRFVISDSLGEPDISYKENPLYGGVQK